MMKCVLILLIGLFACHKSVIPSKQIVQTNVHYTITRQQEGWQVETILLPKKESREFLFMVEFTNMALRNWKVLVQPGQVRLNHFIEYSNPPEIKSIRYYLIVDTPPDVLISQ